jgi:hypothetical protein
VGLEHSEIAGGKPGKEEIFLSWLLGHGSSPGRGKSTRISQPSAP